MNLLEFILYTFIGIGSIVFFWLNYHFSYWQRRGVPHDKPKFIYGNIYEAGRTQFFTGLLRDFYKKYKNKTSYAGYYLSFRRAIVLFDLDLIKTILIKDFNNFSYRGQYYNEKDDPLSAHLFNIDGQKWKTMRAKLTPTFTSGKMKFMYPTLLEVADRFINLYNELIVSGEAESIEVKDLAARFTTDVIGSCAFGLEVNSLKNPKTEFRLKGNLHFIKRRHGSMVSAFLSSFPELGRKLRIKWLNGEMSEFFSKVVRDTVMQRERENIKRNDFMNLLIELKNEGGEKSINIEQMAAQAFVFFIAGFETSSSTMGFALYELAVNQDIQDRARDEVNTVLEKYNGVLTYDAMRELKYLHQVFYETLRHYSIATFLTRICINDYVIPNTDFVIEKNTTIIIPVDAIQHDPEIYPNPMKFDPERFTTEEIQNRHTCAWLPFGDGPRNCIGLRFGEMQAIVGLANLLRNFRFSPSKDTKIPIEIEKKGIILSSKGGIYLKVEKI